MCLLTILSRLQRRGDNVIALSFIQIIVQGSFAPLVKPLGLLTAPVLATVVVLQVLEHLFHMT